MRSSYLHSVNPACSHLSHSPTMKFVHFASILFAGVVLAKNVVYLDDLRAAIDKGSENEKRDAKNVVSLEDLRAAIDEQESESNEPRSLEEVQDFFKKLSKRDQDVVNVGAPLLQNLLPQILTVSIFAGYLRDDDKLLSQMESENSFTILVAPSDSAMSKKLDGVKPWEFPKQVLNDETDDEVVAYNIDHFLKAHILTQLGGISDNNELKSVLLDGREIVVKTDPATGTYRLKIDGEWKSISSASLADNGIVFVIEDVLSLPKA